MSISVHLQYSIFTVQIVIAFPDDGAWKRFHKQLDHFPMVDIFTSILIIILFHYLIIYWMLVIVKWHVVCNQIYEGDKRILRLQTGNSECRYIVIVDDLVQFGGTLI